MSRKENESSQTGWKVTWGQDKGEKGTKVFWGILLLLAAAALVVSRLGYLEGIGIWTILFSAFLVGFFIDGFFKRSFGEILFAIAFFIIVNDELLGLEAITPWPVLWAALLGTIGLKLLFPRFGKHKAINLTMNGVKYDGSAPVSGESWNGGSVAYENAFGESVKYLSGEINHVQVDNAFGSMQVYFTNVTLQGGTASVDVDSAFGSTVLYVPADWKVVISAENAFGGTREQGHCNPNGENVLYIRGDVSFGRLLICYV